MGSIIEIHFHCPNEFTIDLSNLKPMGLLVEFKTTGKEGLATVYDTYNQWGKPIPVKYTYKVTNKDTQHTLFTTCMGFHITTKYNVKVKLPVGATIEKVKLVPLDNWNGISYGTVFNKKHTSAGAQSIAVSNAVKHESYQRNKDSQLLTILNSNDFVVYSYNNSNSHLIKDKTTGHILWQAISNQDILLNPLKDLNSTKENKFNFAINAIFEKDKTLINQNLYIQLTLYDKNKKLLFATSFKNMKDILLIKDKNYEIVFDTTDVPKEAIFFRLYFKSQNGGEYKLPNKIKIYKTFKKCIGREK